MSLDMDYQGFDVEGLVPPHVQSLLKGFPGGITLPAYLAIEPILGRDTMIELLSSYTGSDLVVRALQKLAGGDAPGLPKVNWDNVCRAVANMLRLVLNGEDVNVLPQVMNDADTRMQNAGKSPIHAAFDSPKVEIDPSEVAAIFPPGRSIPSPITPKTIPAFKSDAGTTEGAVTTLAPKSVVDAVNESRATKMYPCNYKDKGGASHSCGAMIEGLVPLYLHHINEHDGKWAFSGLKKLGLPAAIAKVGGGYVIPYYDGEFQRVHGRFPKVETSSTPASAPVPAPASGTVSSTFKPKYDIDLRSIPDGRFAIDTHTSPPEKSWVYLIKTTRKNPTWRAGRFVWGRSSHTYQKVEKGTIEIRVQSGDTKKLVGEQRPGEAVYTGEMEDEIKELMRDPVEAMQAYGRRTKKCAHCGRSLTDPDSLARGIGPDCWEAHHRPFARKLGVVPRWVR